MRGQTAGFVPGAVVVRGREGYVGRSLPTFLRENEDRTLCQIGDAIRTGVERAAAGGSVAPRKVRCAPAHAARGVVGVAADAGRHRRMLCLQPGRFPDEVEVPGLEAFLCDAAVGFAEAVCVPAPVIGIVLRQIQCSVRWMVARTRTSVEQLRSHRTVLRGTYGPSNLLRGVPLPCCYRRVVQLREVFAVHVLYKAELASRATVHLSLRPSRTDATARAEHRSRSRVPPRARVRVVQHTARNIYVVRAQFLRVERWFTRDPGDWVIRTAGRRVVCKIRIRLRCCVLVSSNIFQIGTAVRT